jgi:D-beta-D-heptose 7-phosphate kinase/D-beta-D-heptose 1-phosphate adenosyltransferase
MQIFTPNNGAKVLIVGDVILDRYVYGDTTRISPEAPVPIVHVKKTEERPGGAGNVALNICNLGVKVCLIGITGEDDTADVLEGLLSEVGVECQFIRQAEFPTITKLRVLSQSYFNIKLKVLMLLFCQIMQRAVWQISMNISR